MSVKVKVKQVKSGKDTIVNFNSVDHMAIEGLKGSGFEGKVKAVHKVHGKNLIDKKLAKEINAEVVKEDNKARSTKDIVQ